jgi:hypothetical protein
MSPAFFCASFFLHRLFAPAFCTGFFFSRAATPTGPRANRHDLVIMTLPPCDRRRTHHKKRADTARFFDHR